MGNEASTQAVIYGQRLLNDISVKWQKIDAENTKNPRDGHCAVAIDKKLVVFGGVSFSAQDGGFVESNELLIFDTETKTWKSPALTGQIPSPRSAASLAAVGRKLYLFGGLCQDKGWLDDLHVLDLDIQKWNRLTPTGNPPSPRDKLGAVAMGTKILYFGGFGPINEGMDQAEEGADFTWFNDVHILDTEELSWSKPSVGFLGCPTPRAAFGMCAVGSKLVIFGGRDSQCRKNDLYILDTETFQWSKPTTTGRQPAPRSFHTCTSFGKRSVVFGGRGTQDEHFNDVHVFDTETLEWMQPSCDGAVPPQRGSHAACNVNGNLVVYGGSSKFDRTTMQCQQYHSDVYTILGEQLQSGESQGLDPNDVPATPSTAAAGTEAAAGTVEEEEEEEEDLEPIEEAGEDSSGPEH